jgi:hypothetical protein
MEVPFVLIMSCTFLAAPLRISERTALRVELARKMSLARLIDGW